MASTVPFSCIREKVGGRLTAAALVADVSTLRTHALTMLSRPMKSGRGSTSRQKSG